MSKIEQTRQANQNNDSKRWRTYALMVACILMLVSGFFFAGRQHFSSMDYGMKNSRLRKQVDALEAEKRRLIHAREVSFSPGEIKKAAKKAGMTDQAAIESQVAQVASKEKAPQPADAEVKSLVVKTAAVSPVQTAVAASFQKPEKSAKVVRKSLSTE